jgi:hypothetical protein
MSISWANSNLGPSIKQKYFQALGENRLLFTMYFASHCSLQFFFFFFAVLQIAILQKEKLHFQYLLTKHPRARKKPQTAELLHHMKRESLPLSA